MRPVGPPPAVDLLSDTVTLPPPGMREAMARAEVGDDVYGEDPTVARLQQRVAELLGKAEALLVPSGTLANLLALLAHTPRGGKILVGDASDVWRWEAGGASVLGGVVYAPVPTLASGALHLAALEQAAQGADDPECAPPALVCLENTHCLSGGRVLPESHARDVRAFATRHGLALHLDGARLFNAAAASGRTLAELAQPADSVSVSLSKGLAAPIGSLLAGSADVVARARRLRKMLGGGWRQAGFVAAAGLFALEHMLPRLGDDHAHARRLWEGLGSLPGLRRAEQPPETNMVFFELEAGPDAVGAFLSRLRERGVRMGELGQGRIRAVTHYGIDAADVDRALVALSATLRESGIVVPSA